MSEDKTGSSPYSNDPQIVNGSTATEDKSNCVTISNDANERMKGVHVCPQPAKLGKLVGIKEAESGYKVWFRFELVGLSVMIVIIWGLFALPIVFYHLPLGSSSTNRTSEADNCPSMITYDGTVCKQELKLLSSCLPYYNAQPEGSVLVQSDQSETVRPLLKALDAFADVECRAAALPFLCVYFFGLCDSTGKAYRPSSSQCTEISTGVCAREWAFAGSFPGDMALPDCASFPDKTKLVGSCNNMMGNTTLANRLASASASGQLELNMDGVSSGMMTSVPLNQTCECHEDFFCKETNESGHDLKLACVPECGSWEQYSHSTVIIIDTVVILAAIIGILSGIAGLVIAIVKRKKIIAFPYVLVVYQTVTMLVLVITVLISYTDRTGLYCSSYDLLEAVTTATPFCIITGIVFYYTSMQLAMWWIFHMAMLFWKLRFPFHSRRLEYTGRMKYLHLTAVIIGLFVPVIPVVIAMVNHVMEDSKSNNSSPPGKLGFGLVNFPPILCFGTDSKVIYYSYILPINVILIGGIALLVVAFWIIHKHHGLFRVKHSKNLLNIETAERKILIVFGYYVILAVFSLITFTITTRNVDELSSELLKYFLCERSAPDTPCSREEFEKLSQPVLTSIVYVLLGLFPLVNLSFIVNIREVKQKLEHCLPTIHSQQTTSVGSGNDTPSAGTALSPLPVKRAQDYCE